MDMYTVDLMYSALLLDNDGKKLYISKNGSSFVCIISTYPEIGTNEN